MVSILWHLVESACPSVYVSMYKLHSCTARPVASDRPALFPSTLRTCAPVIIMTQTEGGACELLCLRHYNNDRLTDARLNRSCNIRSECDEQMNN